MAAKSNHASDLVLREDRIIETIATLQRRIGDRFPDSGLAQLCGQLHGVALQAAERSAAIGRPIRWMRVTGYALTFLLIVFLFGLIAFLVSDIRSASGADAELAGPSLTPFEWLQALESGLNDLIFFVIAIVFLITAENRIKRRRALAAIHELRSIAHVIDMHQLTKDPERIRRSGEDTKHSPRRTMTPFLLHRYLDYCSEMLSLTGKIAALYVKDFDDADAVAAVSEVEQLTTGLSRKIWQKIMILEQSRDSNGLVEPNAAAPSESSNQPVAPEHPGQDA